MCIEIVHVAGSYVYSLCVYAYYSASLTRKNCSFCEVPKSVVQRETLLCIVIGYISITFYGFDSYLTVLQHRLSRMTYCVGLPLYSVDSRAFILKVCDNKRIMCLLRMMFTQQPPLRSPAQYQCDARSL